MMEDLELFSEDRDEHFRIENEILRIKLKAEHGDAFQMHSNGEMPPEIENQFLKNMIAFEENYAKAEYTTVFEKIGSPTFVKADILNDDEITLALAEITEAMKKNSIALDVCDGPYENQDRLIYKFITEELFSHEIEKESIFGGTWNFIYEEFHPNNEADIRTRTQDFLDKWFARDFGEYNPELDNEIALSDGSMIPEKDAVKKLNLFFNAFKEFRNDAYNIDNIQVDLQPEGNYLGFAEGTLKYDAEIDNGEIIHFEGPFKLYMKRDGNWWSVFYFVIPGYV